jgi:hypothetical protein
MGDLKTPFSEPAMPMGFDPGGDLPTARGNDPLIDMGGASGLQPIWSDMPVSMGESSETSNSVSGLPAHPDRYQPSEQPPSPPDLTDRSPGTIDQK